jgi:hypothetical protein
MHKNDQRKYYNLIVLQIVNFAVIMRRKVIIYAISCLVLAF